MSGDGAREARGLVGGRQDLRAELGHSLPLLHPCALELFGPQAPEHRARLSDFVGDGPLEIEIGFGRGRFLAELAARRPDTRFLAFEVRTRWCSSLLARLDAEGLTNVRVVRADARAVLGAPDMVADGSVAAVYLLFPDPWWKKRHHRRRVLAPPWLRLLRRKLRVGGALWVKSDVPMTVKLADEVVAEVGGFERAAPQEDGALPRTHRELRCERVGLPVLVRRYVRAEPTVPPRAGG